MAGDFPREYFKAARVALKLSNLRLAELARVSPATLSAVEDPERVVLSRTILQVQSALEEQGVQFLKSDAGVGFLIRNLKRQDPDA